MGINNGKARVFKKASEQFKASRKAVDNYHKGIAAEKKVAKRAQKAVVCQAKKAELDAENARAQAEWVARGLQMRWTCMW